MFRSFTKQIHLAENSQKCYLSLLTWVQSKIVSNNLDQLRNPTTNKGLAFSIQERKAHGLYGLLPPVVLSQKDQERLVLENLKRQNSDLDRYCYLMNLADKNEKLFYRVLSRNVENIMPLVYTPTVGEACLKYSEIFNEPKGMFITIKDKGRVYDVLSNWPQSDVKVICVTDGHRILGLGDLGAQGMGIPVGKLALYTALAGVDPKKCLPITLDVGTNNQKLLNDHNYIGLRQKRVTGQEYDEFIDEFVFAVKKRFGNDCLIQFEDFANENAFRFLKKYQPEACTFNDDIQGTASVALSGVFTALNYINKNIKETIFLFYGAGEAAIGTANLIALALKHLGVSEEKARENIWLVDSKGLIVKDRPEGGLNEKKLDFAKKAPPINKLDDIINFIKPHALIGCAAQGKVFTSDIIKSMSKINDRPIIFALSNPTSKAECTAQEAYDYSNGKVIFASGSPFKTVSYNDHEYHTGQGNNCYIFPGIGLACIAFNIKHVPDEFFLIAAQSVSKMVNQNELDEGRVYPNLHRIQDVSFQIAIDIANYALENNLCDRQSFKSSIIDQLNKVIYKTEYN